MSEKKMLQIKNLKVSYGPINAIQNVNLEVNQGEIVALLGANGAGKTTLLKAILNIEKIEGQVLFKGEEITRKSTDWIVASGINLIPEGHVIFSSMSVLENLQLGAYHNQESFNKDLERVFAYFPILKKRKEQTAGTLSGGEQQMLSIGRALMASPDLILVDEPSLGLAPKIVSEIFNILSGLNREGYTILLSEQNARKSLQLSDRGYVLETGRIVLEGSSEDLLKNEKVKQAYLGGNI